MLSSLLIALAFVTGSASPAPRTNVSVTEIIAAQSATGAPEASLKKLTALTNKAAKRVTAASRSRQTLEGKRLRLRREYNTQLSQISTLSRQRASWNRDRKIRNQKSAAQTLARQLSVLDGQLKSASGAITKARRQLLRAVERELSAGAAGTRGGELRRLRAALARALRPKVRKIILPDESIDRFADPDELDEQVKLLLRAERQLLAEDRKLASRYRYYSRQEKLRAQSERATEIARADGESIRRSPGLGSARTGAADSASGAPEADSDGADFEGGEPPGGGANMASDRSLESSSIVLADVIDQVTAADLRRAGRSANPATKARAASRARKQLKARLERLRRQRAAVSRRANALRTR